MKNVGSLTSDDIDLLKSLTGLAREKEQKSDLAVASEILKKIRYFEAQLSPSARGWWFSKPAVVKDRLLERYIEAYRWKKTLQGYSAFRWIKRRQC
jgi:hypothetical protein